MKNTAPCIKISFSSPKSPKVSSVFCLKNMTHPVCIAYPPSAIRHFRGPLKSPYYNCKEESSSICSVRGPIKIIYGRDWAYIIRLIIEYYIFSVRITLLRHCCSFLCCVRRDSSTLNRAHCRVMFQT